MEDKTLNKHNLASAALSALSMSLIGANAFAQNDGNMPIDLQTQPVEMEARIAPGTIPPPDQPSGPGCEFPQLDVVLSGNGLNPPGTLTMVWTGVDQNFSSPVQSTDFAYMGQFTIGFNPLFSDELINTDDTISVISNQISDMKIYIDAEIKEYDADAYTNGDLDNYESLNYKSLNTNQIEQLNSGDLSQILLQNNQVRISYPRGDGNWAKTTFQEIESSDKPDYGKTLILSPNFNTRFETPWTFNDLRLNIAAEWNVYGRMEKGSTLTWEPKADKVYVGSINITCYTDQTNE